MKIRRLLLALFALAGSAAAQFTVVTGTVTDPNGLPYANGTISPGLVFPGGTSVTLNGLPYSPPSGPTQLDASGKFTIRLGDNSVLLPGGTQWTFLICSAAGTIQPAGGKGPVCFNVPALTISGSSQSITSNITAVALALSNTLAGAVTASGSPVAGNIPKFTSATNIAPAAASDIVNLFSTCSGVLYLGADGACHASGSGSVTNTAGSLTSGNVVIGNGGNDEKVDTALSTNGAGAQTDTQGTITASTPVFSHTVTWNAGGVAFSNWVSNITCTAAATGSIAMEFGVSGTTFQFIFNGANCTNPQFVTPAGSSANPPVAIGESTSGFYRPGSHQIGFSSNNFVSGNINGSDGFDLNAADFLGWCSSGGTCTGGDVTISRVTSNGILGVGKGSGAPTGGTIRDAGYISAGITFTSSGGCSETSLSGGATAGQFTSGTSGTCATTITMGSAPTNAPAHWACQVTDQTTHVLGSVTSSTTNTVAITVATTSGDTVVLGPCEGY